MSKSQLEAYTREHIVRTIPRVVVSPLNQDCRNRTDNVLSSIRLKLALTRNDLLILNWTRVNRRSKGELNF